MKIEPNDKRLKNLKIFAELSSEELKAVISNSSVEDFAAGTKVISEGEDGHAMYVVLEGSARVCFGDRLLTELRPGDFFGEVSLVDDGPRSADVVAVTDCTTLMITRMTLGILAGVHPNAAIHLLAGIGKSLVSKLRAGNARFREAILVDRVASSPSPKA